MLVAQRKTFRPWLMPDKIPNGALEADQAKLLHDNTYDVRPRYYVDERFTCIDCGVREVWTAAQQKWWYEEAKGKIASKATRCRECRRKHRLRRSQERRIHIEGLIEKHGLEGAALKLKQSVGYLISLRERWPR
jgi:hypothetical protein